MRFIDYNIIYLNLEKRKDRKQFIENQLSKFKILDKCKLINSIDGQLIDDNEYEYHMSYFKVHKFSKIKERILGKIGCYLTHLKALEHAINNNYDNVIILEDDCSFHSFDKSIEINPPDNCDIFYLGGLFWRKKAEDTLQTGNWVNINNKHLKIACALAYGIIGKDKIRYIYNIIKNSQAEAIDLMYIKNIQVNGNCYIMNPVICKQNIKLSSDVTNLGGTSNKFITNKNAFKYI